MRNDNLRAPHAGGTLARRTAFGVLVSVVALVVVQTLVDVFAVDVGDSMSPFATGPLAGTAMLAGAGAAVAYAAVVAFITGAVEL